MKAKAFLSKNLNFISAALMMCVILTGGFNDYLSCFFSTVFLCFLAVKIIKNKTAVIYPNLQFIASVLIAVSYFAVMFWAVDKGMAFIGFLKFLPVPLFALSIMQEDRETYDYLISLPYLCSVLVIVSAVFTKLGIFDGYFSVAGRISGTLQYPNTFALLLLVSLIITVSKDKLCKADYAVITVLLAGIILTGSRTVFVLTGLSVIALLFIIKNKKIKIAVVSLGAALTLAAGIYALVSGNLSGIGRFLTISLSESTFVGRFLYFKDALPIILRHPFGLGYMGYFFEQSEFQTGVYSVKYIHNEFLQLMLDVGWIPAAVFAAAFIKTLFTKSVSVPQKLIITVIFLHLMFDFDLAFISVCFVLLCVADVKSGEPAEFAPSRIVTVSLCAAAVLLNLYMLFPLTLNHFKKYELSHKLYKYNTLNNISLMEITEDDGKYALSDEILKANSHVYQAYDVKALYYYSQGDFEKVIKYKHEAFRLGKFAYESRLNYCKMLINGIELYAKAKDSYSADICRKELLETAEDITGSKDKLSKLGSMIKDQPTTELDTETEEYVKSIKK